MNDDPTLPTPAAPAPERLGGRSPNERNRLKPLRVRYSQHITKGDVEYINAVVAGGPFLRLNQLLPASHSRPVTDLDRFQTNDVRRLLTGLIATHHPERLPELRRLVASLALNEALLGKGRPSRARLALEALKLDKAAEAASVASKARAAAQKPDSPINGILSSRDPRSLS